MLIKVGEGTELVEKSEKKRRKSGRNMRKSRRKMNRKTETAKIA